MKTTVDITLSELQDGAEAIVERWLRKPGENVRIHEPLLEVNTDKAVVEVPAPASGILKEVLKQVNDTILRGEILGRIEATDSVVSGSASASQTVPARPGTETTTQANLNKDMELSPAVRQLVKKHQVDVARISGTGRGGRVTHDDMMNYINRQSGAAVPGENRRVTHSPTRRRIAQHMVDSMLKTAPHVTAVFDADLAAAVAHRNQFREAVQKRGTNLTYTAYFVAAAVKALQAVPEINSRWHDDALEIFAECNIGVAAATKAGLVVPVIHRAEKLDLVGIASQLQALTERARGGKLTPDDLRGGTFTITNHGVSGSLIATPIINQPQSAILGIGKMEKRVVVVEQASVDSIQIRPMAYVTLTIDHRALDGYQANAFLMKFVHALSQWDAVQ